MLSGMEIFKFFVSDHLKFGEDPLTVFEIFSKKPRRGGILPPPPPVQIELTPCLLTFRLCCYLDKKAGEIVHKIFGCLPSVFSSQLAA